MKNKIGLDFEKKFLAVRLKNIFFFWYLDLKIKKNCHSYCVKYTSPYIFVNWGFFYRFSYLILFMLKGFDLFFPQLLAFKIFSNLKTIGLHILIYRLNTIPTTQGNNVFTVFRETLHLSEEKPVLETFISQP